jgi:hypothetical protein
MVMGRYCAAGNFREKSVAWSVTLLRPTEVQPARPLFI